LRQIVPEFSLQGFGIGDVAFSSEDYFVVRAMGAQTATKRDMDIEMGTCSIRKFFSLTQLP
jgi:hypothetical protein